MKRAKKRQTYPVVDIGSSIDNLGPEESLAKGVPHRLALPKLRVNLLVGNGSFNGLYTLFFKDSVRSRLQLPEERSQFRNCFSHNQRNMWHYTFVVGVILEATVHTLC